MTTDAIDVTATEEPSMDLEPATPHGSTLAVTPQVTAAELVERLAVIRDAMDNAMEEGVDYGVIPGTNKPALLKPGSEKLGVLFQLDIQLDNEKVWGPGDHLTVLARATAYHAPSGTRLGFGEGLCTTRERKYAYRKQERTCPTCGAAAVIKGKQEFGGGWLCWKKRDGCGAKFPDGAGAIEGQPTGEVDNPDLPDLWNTVIKMAEKRARIDAVLAVTGASALFTQDIEPPPPVGESPDEAPEPEPVDESPQITSDEADLLMQRITIALQGGLDTAELAAMFERSGARPERINGEAVANLTKRQAADLLQELDPA